MLERYWTPNTPRLYGIPGYGQALDWTRPMVYLANDGAGNVNTGTHRYKISFTSTSGETRCGDYSALITTDTGSNGKVVIVFPGYPGSNGAAPIDPGTAWNIYRSETGGTGTYKLVNSSPIAAPGVYVDNIADASLGAAEPGSNTTSPAVADPPLLSTTIAALTAGSSTDYLVAYYMMQWRWTLQTGAGNNTLLFVPGSWTTSSATYPWPYIPINKGWTPTETATAASSIPAYSTDWDAMKLLMWEAAQYRYVFTNIDAGNAGDPLPYFVTVTADGGTEYVGSLSTADRESVPLEVCKGILTVLHDPDWY